MNGPLSLEVALAPTNGEGQLVTGVFEDVRYIGSRSLLLRQDAWDLDRVDPLLLRNTATSPRVRVVLAESAVQDDGLRIHPYFRWVLGDEHGLTLVPTRSTSLTARWQLYDADTFVGVAGASTGDYAVGHATSLQRTKNIAEVLWPMATEDGYEGAGRTDWWSVWQYARLVDVALTLGGPS